MRDPNVTTAAVRSDHGSRNTDPDSLTQCEDPGTPVGAAHPRGHLARRCMVEYRPSRPSIWRDFMRNVVPLALGAAMCLGAVTAPGPQDAKTTAAAIPT